MRGALRSIALALLVLLGLTRTAAASPCLSGHVGDELSARLAAKDFDGVLPPGWTLTDVEVEKDRIDLRARDAQGRPRGVALRLGDGAPGVIDGRGRWFVFTIDAGSEPLDDAGRRGLLDLATRVDGTVTKEEALRDCSPGPPGSQAPSFGDNPKWWAERGGAVPPWMALLAGGLEVMLVVGVLLLSRARRPRPLDLAMFAVAGLVIHAWGGASPVLWLDTINDQRDVRQCLVQGACTTLGEAASVSGLHHAVGWLDFLDLAALAGLGIGALHLVFQGLTAAGVMLAGATARERWGRLAGVFAAVACLGFTTRAVNGQALYNTTPLPFLGAVFLVAGVACVKRPGAGSVAVVALVGALLASFHAACVVSIASVVWIALLAPRHRIKLASLGLAVFLLAAVAIGPAAWITTAEHVLAAVGAPRGTGGASHGVAWSNLADYGMLMVLAIGARFATPRGRRAVVDVALAITLPMLGASFAAATTSAVSTNPKYFAHVTPAGAVLVAALATPGAAWISAFLARRTALPATVVRVVPAVVYAAVAYFSGLWSFRPTDSLSFREAASIPRELGARGWTYSKVRQSLRSPDSAEILESFEVLAPDFPAGPGPQDATSVYVLKVPRAAVPQPLPERWVVASQDGGWSVVLVFVRSFLSWSHFMVCDPRAAEGTERCVESGLSLPDDEKPRCAYCVPGMPPFHRGGEHALEMRMAVVGAAGEPHALVMPHARALLCKGVIASVPGGPAAISADHRRATWVEALDGQPQEVQLEWVIGSPDCDASEYSGLPPFFLEGDPATVAQLERLGL